MDDGSEEVAATYDEDVEGTGGPADRGRCGVRRWGVGLVGAAAVGLVLAEVRFVKRHVGNGHGPGSNHVPSADGRYGHSYDTPGEPPCA